jgi:hypothetical protein
MEKNACETAAMRSEMMRLLDGLRHTWENNIAKRISDYIRGSDW